MAEAKRPGLIDLMFNSGFAKLAQRMNSVVFKMTGGKLGGKVGRAPIGLLTTIGRKSGKPRTVPLLYLEDGGNIIVVASKGGMDKDPLWYLNLKANPDVEMQTGSEHKKLRAETANAEQRTELWPKIVAMYSNYSRYQTWTDRQIPVVILSPHG